MRGPAVADGGLGPAGCRQGFRLLAAGTYPEGCWSVLAGWWLDSSGARDPTESKTEATMSFMIWSHFYNIPLLHTGLPMNVGESVNTAGVGVAWGHLP